jgi:hypothetical protein
MSIWKFLDELKISVWCICLEERDDRHQAVLKEFKKVGLLDRVNFHRPKRDPNGGRIGSWDSHIHCMSQKENIKLIFEDDIKFQDGWEAGMVDVIKFLKTNYLKDWDLLRLGGVIQSYDRTSNVQSIHLCKTWNIHAYFINPNGLKKISKTYDNYPHMLDDYIIEALDKDYITYPDIVIQKNDENGSDNQWAILYGGNIIQMLIQGKYTWEFCQVWSNVLAWNIRCFPKKVQAHINPYGFLYPVVKGLIFLGYIRNLCQRNSE